MKQFRWLVASFVLGVILGAAPSCSGSKLPCGSASCDGCCDSSGACIAGTSASACGKSGAACSLCLPGQSCQGGACSSALGDGGCGPGSCSGCCNAAGTCLLGVDTAACGNNGETCQACSGGQLCTAEGFCRVPEHCSGCVDGTGLCRPGNTNLQCGADGGTCQTCLGGQVCQNAACVAPTCDASNCAGCCHNGACVLIANQSLSQCGLGGQACQACNGSQICSAGACVAACGPLNCGGCCNGSACLSLPNQSNNQCGTGGVTCQICTGGTSCQSGACALTMDGGCSATNCAGCCIGNACVPVANESNSQCGTGGAACAQCPTNQTCQSGACALPPCGPSNCTGCCSGPTTCLPLANETPAACGSNGGACVACNTNYVCNAGSCQLPACTASQCRAADNSCANPSNTTCGQNGAACVDCTQNPFAIYCGVDAHTCITGGAGLLGTPCGSDLNCFPGVNSGAPYCRGLPEGYCEDVCDTTGKQIGICALNTCLPLTPIDGGPDYAGICVKSCPSRDAGECGHSPGTYICDTVGLLPHCMPACSSAGQCQGWFGNPLLSCNTNTQQCCGTKGFACCGASCFDGTSCLLGICN